MCKKIITIVTVKVPFRRGVAKNILNINFFTRRLSREAELFTSHFEIRHCDAINIKHHHKHTHTHFSFANVACFFSLIRMARSTLLYCMSFARCKTCTQILNGKSSCDDYVPCCCFSCCQFFILFAKISQLNRNLLRKYN